MAADFGNAALIDDRDAVRVANRGKPVGDDQRGASFGQCIERCLNRALGLRVERVLRSPRPR